MSIYNIYCIYCISIYVDFSSLMYVVNDTWIVHLYLIVSSRESKSSGTTSQSEDRLTEPSRL